jgi:DNA-binding transcriptional LysR family regulator
MYDRLSPLLSQLDGSFVEASRQAKGEEGLLAVAMVATVACSVLPEVLPAFYLRHPSVYLSIRDGFAGSITNLVEQRQAEFGITTHMAFGDFLDVQRLGIYGFNLVSREAETRFNGRKSVKWSALAGLKVVGLNPLSSTRLQVDGELNAAGIALPWTFEADQLSTLLEMVRIQNYVTVLPSVFQLPSSGFKVTTLVDPLVRRELSIIKRKNASLSAPATTLLALLQAQFKQMRQPRLARS